MPAAPLSRLMQRDVVMVPKSVRRERMEQNIDVFDFVLTDDDMARIATMDTGASLFFDHRDPAMGQLAQHPQGDPTRLPTREGTAGQGPRGTARPGRAAHRLASGQAGRA